GMGLDAEPIAALGFVVVAVDGRGTPGRTRPPTGPVDAAGVEAWRVVASRGQARVPDGSSNTP
ncbi:hypothetical protein ACWDAZ_22820, partial [Streptomyces sp. NPDC001215]